MNSEADSQIEPASLTYANIKPKRKRLLLVVFLVAVAGLFAALVILPFSLLTKPQAPYSICRRNLRELGQAMYIYSQGYDNGDYPDDILQCVAQGNTTTKEFDCDKSHTHGTSYFYIRGKSRLSNPSDVLIYEIPQNHGGGGNVLYADGHVAYVKIPQLQAIMKAAAATGKVVPVKDPPVIVNP